MASTLEPTLSKPHYARARRGDVNAFFGPTLDNVGDMILTAGLPVGVYGFPKAFVPIEAIKEGDLELISSGGQAHTIPM